MTKLDTLFRILVLAIMKLSDQELSIALEEFERTMVDISELFLPLLENRLDLQFVRLLNQERCDLQCLFDLYFKRERLFEIP